VRTIYLPQKTIDLLIQEHAKHPNNPIMFPSPVTGKLYGPDCIGRLHKNLLKKAGITENIPFHGLRHTFATLAIQQGVDAKNVSSILGHYSAGFTLDTYTHVTNEMQKDAAQRMGTFMAQTI
jgi:integrase